MPVAVFPPAACALGTEGGHASGRLKYKLDRPRDPFAPRWQFGSWTASPSHNHSCKRATFTFGLVLRGQTMADDGDAKKLAFTVCSLDEPDPFAERTSIPTGVEDALR